MARSGGKIAKGEPFSVRFAISTDLAVEDEARRLRRSKSSIVEALTEEAMRLRRFPGIAFRGDDVRRRPWAIGSGLDIWEICQLVEEAGSIEELVAAAQVTLWEVELAAAYRERYPEEIDDAIEENRRPVEEWRELYPFVRVPGATR